MNEERMIQVNLQLPAAALDGLSKLAERLMKLAAAVNGSDPPVHASEESGESRAFDPERFQTLRSKEAGNMGSEVSERIPEPKTAEREIPENANETKQEGIVFAVGSDIDETGPQTVADNSETDREGIPAAWSEADGRIPDPQAVRAVPESPIPDAEAVWEEAEERDIPLPSAWVEASAEVNVPPRAGLAVTAQPEAPASRWAGLVEELAAEGPAPLTAEAVSLAFQRDGRRYDNGFPLY